MRPALTSDHREFFAKNQFIAFENLLTEAQIEKLQVKLETLLAKRTKKSDPFLLGRDLWRDEEKSRTLPSLLPSHFHETAANLFKRRPLRIGYDQYFHNSKSTNNPYKKEQLSLKQMSSLSPVRGGALVRIKESAPHPELPLSSTSGSALFFTADLPLFLPALFEPDSCLYLFVYAEAKTLYLPQENDPRPHSLKHEGYVVSEPLHEQTHPFVIR